MSTNFFNTFHEKHPYLLHSIIIALTTIALGYVFLLFIDVFTSHGEQRLVPDVRYLPMDEAIAKLEAAGLKWDVSDSINYNESYKPGAVIDQDPKAGSYIKSIRTVFLKVNALHDRMVNLPEMAGIMSVRQGVATLQSMGFKDVEVDSVPSANSGLILQVTVNGHNFAPGKPVSVKAHVRLIVGDGSIDIINPDSILDAHTIDSIEQRNYEEDVKRYAEEQKQRAEQARINRVDEKKKADVEKKKQQQQQQ